MKNVPFPRLNAPALGCPIRLTTNQTLGKFSEKHGFSNCLAKNQDRINAGTPLPFGAARSNLQPLARGGDAVTPSLILMRKTDAVRADDLPNAEWNDMGEVKVMGKEGVCALCGDSDRRFRREEPRGNTEILLALTKL